MYPIYPTVQNTFPAQFGASQPTQIQYVNDRSNVDSCYLPPNSSGIYMDANKSRFYTKHTDASGSAVIRSFDFKETEEEKPAEYVTKQEFEKFKAMLKGDKHESSNDAREEQ